MLIAGRRLGRLGAIDEDWGNKCDNGRSRDYTGSVKIRAVATDALGNDYTSNPVEVA
jgi:hypothetical protein